MKEFKQENYAKIDQATAKQNEFNNIMRKAMQKQQMKVNEMSTLITTNNNNLILMIKNDK